MRPGRPSGAFSRPSRMIARKLHFDGGGGGGGGGRGGGGAGGGGGDRPRRRRERSINGGFSCTVALPGSTGRAA